MSKILLVDDDEMVLGLLAKVLAEDGFEVVTARSAERATAILAQHESFDIVVTDLRMESPLAGFDVVRAANQAVPRPIIVVLTAFPVPSSDWQNAGADALYVKGMNTIELPEKLNELLEQRAATRKRQRERFL